ncbi:MAG: PhnD/SsuA/transferrin family substrate-binding protein [Burkholderiales bacterium]|nr:PhnD/SsuA/transferrin family substrate-binding protein [Burkholderiales bacterium]
MKRRTLCSIGLAALAPTAWAQAPVVQKKPAPPTWRLVINEAVTGETNFFLLTNRYQPLADFVTAQFKGRTIGIEPVVDIKRFMAVAQGQPRPDLVFGKSVNQLAKLVRDDGYQPVVRRSDPYKAAFIVARGSPIKTLADAAQSKIIMPDEYAATTAVARAELRRQNVTATDIIHVRYQEAVTQQLQAGLAHVGVVNPTIAKKWVEQGGRVLAETQPVVNWSVLASPQLSAEAVNHLREVLLSMNTQAPAVIGALGVKEWARAERKEYMALLDYTKE